MKSALFSVFAVALLSLPLPGFAADDTGCNFAAPAALLQAQAYRGYKFQRSAENTAIESGDISKDIHFQIQQDQCVDFVVRTYTFTLKSSGNVRPLDLAISEISSLKFTDAHEKPTDLLTFLKTAYRKGSESRFSACKDGSSAPSGECSWESMGGYSFEVDRERTKIVISVTEYTSG